jgi:hypothetical protein
LASNQDFTAKLSEALNTAARCEADETVANYSVLSEQLNELSSSVGQSLQSHTGYQSLASKRQNGSPLTADELKTLRSLIVGDALLSQI